MYSPLWVPLTVLRVTTLSPSAIRSLISTWRSGKAARSRRTISFSAAGPVESSGSGVRIRTSGETTSSIVRSVDAGAPASNDSWKRRTVALLRSSSVDIGGLRHEEQVDFQLDLPADRVAAVGH